MPAAIPPAIIRWCPFNQSSADWTTALGLCRPFDAEQQRELDRDIGNKGVGDQEQENDGGREFGVDQVLEGSEEPDTGQVDGYADDGRGPKGVRLASAAPSIRTVSPFFSAAEVLSCLGRNNLWSRGPGK